MKVLLVDDNITDLNGLRDFTPWEKLDCEVVATARNGEEGVQAAKKTSPDLIIADISMPIMDGITMSEEIRKTLPNVKIIFLSCLEDFEYAKKAISLGGCDYITKPIDINLVIQSIMKMKNAHEKEIKKEIVIFNLEKEINQNRSELIKSFLRDVLLGITANKNFIHRKSNEFKINTDAPYTTILFETNDTSENSSLSSLLCSNLIRDLLFEDFNGWVVDIKIGSAAAVVYGNIDLNSLVDILGSIQYNFLEICDAELTICVGTPNIGFSQLHEEFDRISKTIGDNLFYTPNSIVLADEFHNIDTYSSDINFSDLNKDISTVLASDFDDTVKFLIDKYIPKNNQLLARTTATYITICLSTILQEMNISSELFYIEGSLKSITGFKSHSQIKAFLTDMLLKCKHIINTNPNTSTDYITENILHAIDEGFSEIQTIEDITDKLYLNPMYANRVFRKTTGKTIYEYLLLVRMEKAIDLLKFSSLKAGEVGEAVGYKTARYFSTVFKKHTGLTPIQYRTKFSENNVVPEEE